MVSDPVYGAAQDDYKFEYLSELARMCGSGSLPTLVGGDFNILPTFLFNAIIESLDLREIELSGRQFTWANRRDTPTF